MSLPDLHASKRVVRLALVCVAATIPMLAACGDGSGTAPRTSADTILPDSAEQGVFGVSIQLTTAGVAKGMLLSDTLYTYESGNRLELRPVNVTFFDSLGAEDGIMTSREGTYNKRLGLLEARGSVVIVRDNGTRLETPKLVYDERRNQIYSDSSFVLNEPPKRQLSGIGFESDPQLTQFRILKKAGGVIPVTVDQP